MTSMKKTLLLSVALLSSATAFGMDKFRVYGQKVTGNKWSSLIAACGVTALAQNVKELHPKATAANAKLAEVLKVDNQAVAQTAAVEALCLAASHFVGDKAVAGLSVNNVVHAVRGANYANFVANSGHLNLVVNKLPEAYQAKARVVLGAAATAALYVAAAKTVAFVNQPVVAAPAPQQPQPAAPQQQQQPQPAAPQVNQQP